jgi:hypothetical protein
MFLAYLPKRSGNSKPNLVSAMIDEEELAELLARIESLEARLEMLVAAMCASDAS